MHVYMIERETERVRQLVLLEHDCVVHMCMCVCVCVLYVHLCVREQREGVSGKNIEPTVCLERTARTR